MSARPCCGHCITSLPALSGRAQAIAPCQLHPLSPVRHSSGHLRQTRKQHSACSRNRSHSLVCLANRDAKQIEKKQQSEKSLMVHAELIYFMYQLNLDTQLQRTLNMDDFDTAQAVRDRRKQIDELVAEQLASKGPGCGTRSANQTALADLASEGLRVRSELQRAVDEERYSDAAAMRDRLKVIQEQSEQAQSEAANVDRPARQYRLGQRVRHTKLGYDGVVCGWDNCCCESVAWQDAAGVPELTHNREQTFYQLLVDAKDWEASWEQPPVAYVAEELLSAPEAPQTWSDEYGYDSFDHVYLYTLFLGQDAQGNMLPVRQLRDRYSQQRRDVHPKDDVPDKSQDEPETD